MADERWDFTVLRPIADRHTSGTAYLPGEGIMAQVVDDLGLVVGEDVTPARPNSMEQPAGNASRADWARYAAIQGMPQERVDGLTRDQIRDEYVPAEQPVAAKPAKTVKGAEPVKGD